MLSAKEIIAKSCLLYKKNWLLFLKYSLLLYLPPAVATSLAFLTGLSISVVASNKYGLLTFFVFFLIDLVISSIISLWFSLAFIRIIAKKCNGKTPLSMLEEIKSAKILLKAGIITSIIVGATILGGTILGILPGIIFGLWYVFSLLVVALEEKTGLEAMFASKQLVAGRWWKVGGLILAPILVYIIGALILDIGIFRTILSYANVVSPATAMAMNLLKTLLTWSYILLTVPFLTTAQIILYLELKKNPLGR